MQLVLSLFPGIDLLGRAFREEGFCVVQGGDVIFGGDIRDEHYPARRFDGVIGGPPCQAFSRMARINLSKGRQPAFGNLIPEFERVVCEAAPQWWVMENVPDAPLPSVPSYGIHSFILNNRQCPGPNGEPPKQNRRRRWSFGWRGCRIILPVDVLVFENPLFEGAATGHCTSWSKTHKRPEGSRSARNFEMLKRKQGLPNAFDLPSFRVDAKCQAVGNAVPLPMGRAIAKAIKEVCDAEENTQRPPQDDQPTGQAGPGAQVRD